jgi:hypothetical protein
MDKKIEEDIVFVCDEHGKIYLSKEGSDENKGTETEPVKTLGKALLLLSNSLEKSSKKADKFTKQLKK